MAALDVGARPRDSLPSISHLSFAKGKSDQNDHSRYFMVDNGISTAPLASPTSLHSGPPPPYSCPSSAAGSVSGPSGLSGYISPPDSTRRSTRDEKESPGSRKSLPSIHEALGAPLAAPSQHQPGPASSTTVGQSFPDGPKGPVNPFSQPPMPRDVFSSGHKPTTTQADVKLANPSYSPTSGPDPRQPVSQHFGYPGSPRPRPVTSFRSSSLTNTSFNSQEVPPPSRSPQTYEASRHSYPYSQYNNSNTTSFPPPPPHQEQFQFSAGPKSDENRAPHTRPCNDMAYSDTVKRHLDVFDAELGLNEIVEASARTMDFSRIWAQRCQSSNRSGYYHENLPPLADIDEMLRHSHRIFENLTHLREVAVAQQAALSEQRARLARGGPLEDDYHGLPDEYKNGAFVGGDAKKRRGKAAPPGRCHSCNRAETPEWRRGPDGARTLCNACGLHYAKLTRKMGVNKASSLTGSNLRPKNLDSTRP